MIYGYIRVSTKEQNEERQLIAMRIKNMPAKNLAEESQEQKNKATL